MGQSSSRLLSLGCRGQHPKEDNKGTETGHSRKEEDVLRKDFSQRWEHTWVWEMEALEMRGLGRELGPVVDGEGQLSQQLYPSSIEISKAQLPHGVYRCMEPEVLKHKICKSSEMEMESPYKWGLTQTGLWKPAGPQASVMTAAQNNRPTRHSRKTHAGSLLCR